MLTLPGDLVIESVSCPFDTVILEQTGIPVTVRVANTSGTTIVVRNVQLIFSEGNSGDRNVDYIVTGDVTPEVTVPSGGSTDLVLLVEVDKEALTSAKIRIDAYVYGERLDDLEAVSDSTSSETAVDRFDAVSYEGNNGSVDWLTPWQETGGEDDGPSAGTVSVVAAPVADMGLSLSIGGVSIPAGTGASRGVDLSRASSARIAFLWMRDPAKGLIGTNVRVQISSDGISWDDLEVIGEGLDPTPYISSFDITPHISADTRIRFITDSPGTGRIYFDNVVVNYSDLTGAHAWTVLAEGLTSIFALFDTRMTPDRSDDSLIVVREGDIFQLNTDYHVASGQSLADILFERSSRYRLVIQLHSFTDWDWEPKEIGRGSFSLADPAQSIGRLSSPLPGVPELLFSEAMVADEEADPIDFVMGATVNSNPPPPWDMVTDPWIDPAIDDGKLGEYGTLRFGLDPARWHIDCRDEGKHWEVTGQCESDRYYFFEAWFTPDLEWSHGQDLDVQLAMDGNDGHGDIPGLHAHFTMVDDDTEGPAITDFTPELVRVGDVFSIYCRINDPSGVFDDASGSAGQGVYLIWDTDGDLENGHNEVQMSLVSGDLYATDTDLSGFAEGEEIVYAVCAHDDDADRGPGDRSLSVSGKQRITVLGAVALFDATGSLWPVSVYPSETSVIFFIDLMNPNPGDMRLWTSSFIRFTDGTDTVTAMLENETLVPAGSPGSPLRFESSDIPADFSSPDTLDVILGMEGLYDGSTAYSQTWRASYTNRLIVKQPLLHLGARTVAAAAARPGDRLVEVLRIEVSCESMTDIVLDSLTVSDLAPVGSRSASERSANVERLYLYRQADPAGLSELLIDAEESRLEGFPGGYGLELPVMLDQKESLADRPFDSSDSLIAASTVENGMAVFRPEGGCVLPSWESEYLYVTADVDSFDAVDGESLTYGIEAHDRVAISGYASVSTEDSPLLSPGTPVIDGFVSHQAYLVTDLPETLYSGDEYGLVMAVELPANGNTPDVLNRLSMVNYGDESALDALEAVALWIDDGDGSFSVYTDIYQGEMLLTGDRYEISGLSIPVPVSRRIFVTAEVGFGFTLPLQLHMGIPAMGVDYASGNDGPIDGPITYASAQQLIRREIVYVSSLFDPEGPAKVFPGQEDVELMALRLTNSTLGLISVDSLTVQAAGGSFECEPVDAVSLYLDDGDGAFDTASDALIGAGGFDGTTGYFEDVGIDIPADGHAVLFVAADLDSFLTADGETLSLELASQDEIHLSAGTPGDWEIEGIFPAGNLNLCITDGMLSHQLEVFPGADSTVTGSSLDIQILDLHMPGNGCIDDTLSAITVVNLGTADQSHIERMLLWSDDGNGVFDPLSDDSIAVMSRTAPRRWEASGLSLHVDGSSGARIFASIDLVEGFGSGATIQAGIPVAGIEVSSGNDGPMDRGVFDENTLVIPIPDRVTFFASSLENKKVMPGQGEILNMVIGAYNSYDEPRTLDSIVLLQGGTAATSEISQVKAWLDTDGNGLFDPGTDGLLGEVEPAGVLVKFEGLDFSIDPLESDILFITYSIPPAGVRDSVSVDFSVPDATLIGFTSGEIQVEGDFPLNSAGLDVTDGMTAAQIELMSSGGGRVSPGDTDVPCISVRIPCNGSVTDSLKSFSVSNTGTCQPGIDIVNLRLWMESGGTSDSFDPGEEIELDLLVWDGSGWASISDLSTPVDCAGLVLHVTADFAPTAVDGRTVIAGIPLNGIQVFTGNDGPIDAAVTSAGEILVTTVPLLAQFEPHGRVTRGQQFDIVLGVSNIADSVLTSVEPDSFGWSGDGSMSLLSGPMPAAADIPGNSSVSFNWSFTSDSPGRAVFRARAVERGGSAVSWFDLSDTLIIEEVPDFVNVTLDDVAPVSLNRGHVDAAVFEMLLTYGSACSGCADVELSSLSVTFTDGQGQPLAVSDLASRVRLEDETMSVFSCETADSNDYRLSITPSIPIILHPGTVKALRFSLDVADAAPAGDFRAGVAGAQDLEITDVNSGLSVPFGGASLPWSTNTVTLKDPVTELVVDLIDALPSAVNRGQEGVETFDIQFVSSGGPSASDISISSVKIVTKDGSGFPAGPGDILRKLRLEDDLGFVYFSAETFPSPEWIICEFEPELRVSPGMPLVLTALLDILDEPAVPGFSILIPDSLDVAARDVNSGDPVEIVPGPISGAFPMQAGPSSFSYRMSGFTVSGSGVIPGNVTAGMSTVPVSELTLSHTGPTGESPATVSGLELRILDTEGYGLSPRDYLDGLHLVVSDTVSGSLYISAADSASVMTIGLDQPLEIDPSQSEDMTLICDISADAVPGVFQLRIGEGGLKVADATDGMPFAPVDGDFPVSSGLCRIVQPASEVSFNAEPKLAANAASGGDVSIFDVSFEFSGTSGGSDVMVESIRFVLLDADGAVADPSLTVESMRFEGADGAIPLDVSMDATGINGSLNLPQAVAEGIPLDFSVYFSLRSRARESAFSVRIDSPSDISCSDEVTGGPVSVEPASGASFPFVTSRAALLAAATAESFSNYPNPFVPARGPTTVAFYLSEPSTVTLEIYTMMGRLVTRLLDGRRLESGLHQNIVWDGGNDLGERVLSGVYLMVLTTATDGSEQSFRRKVSVIR
jgi:hypothetical protein